MRLASYAAESESSGRIPARSMFQEKQAPWCGCLCQWCFAEWAQSQCGTASTWTSRGSISCWFCDLLVIWKEVEKVQTKDCILLCWLGDDAIELIVEALQHADVSLEFVDVFLLDWEESGELIDLTYIVDWLDFDLYLRAKMHSFWSIAMQGGMFSNKVRSIISCFIIVFLCSRVCALSTASDL